MVKPNDVLVVKPNEVQIERTTLYQDDLLIVISNDNGMVKLERLNDGKIVYLPEFILALFSGRKEQ